MRKTVIFSVLLTLVVAGLFGCALGKKEWPEAQESEDRFLIKLLAGDRQNECLTLDVAVTGATHRLYRATIQYEIAGGLGGGCEGCPFVPREAVHFTRNSEDFVMNGNKLTLSMCSLEPGNEYRFRVAGKSELPTSPLVYTDVYVTTP